ncbi:uncharacterized protein comr [Calliphora vicina]|uniref:uncharacterized protein comr n=1 Tax=Calliphora vicina TaxID=7373 RepID=UPI00325A7B94
MDTNYPYITRQDIVNFPFPYKLWLVVNLEHCDFLRWNRDGTVVLLDLVDLEDYLNSTRSIFKIKNSSTFLQHLEEFKFERLNATPEAEEDLLLQYRNENFQRHRLDLLAKIRRHTYQLIGQLAIDNCAESEGGTKKFSNNVDDESANIPKLVSNRMLGDLCFMFHGGLSKIKRSRLRFETLLHFHNEQRILKEKLKASESFQTLKTKPDVSMGSSAISPYEDQVIELPIELFENPHDSVLNLGADFRPEYAGYYGNCSKDQILQFFGEYLPMYEDNSVEVKKIVTDNSTASGNNTLPIIAEPNIMQYSSPNVTENPNIYISTPIATNFVHNLNFSSNLEPIYITNENSENINPNNGNTSNDFTVTQLNSSCLDNEADISMDEFIKFKDSRSENLTVDCPEINNAADDCAAYSSYPPEQVDTNAFPQMPTSIQKEISEDVKENEANFRSFFSQYRASLNILYERQ